MEVSDDGSKITIEVLIDEVVYQRYLKTFHPQQFEQAKKGRLEAPSDW